MSKMKAKSAKKVSEIRSGLLNQRAASRKYGLCKPLDHQQYIFDHQQHFLFG
jgi:hypothetical protein